MTSRTGSKQLVTPGISIYTLPGQGLFEGPDSKLGPAAQLFHSSKGLIVLDQVLRSAKGGSVDPPSAGDPTARSAMMKVSSVSPEQWNTTMPQLLDRVSIHTCRGSDAEPIWFALSGKQLHGGSLIASSNPFSAGYCEITLNHVDACLAVHFGQLPSQSGQRGSQWTPLDTPR